MRGVETHLLEGGRGRPLLVLHPEFAADRWLPFHDRLAARCRVLAPDHPGFGQSESPDWLEEIDDLVFHYLDLLDLLRIDRLSIVGSSLGGWIAAAFAVSHPERVDRLVLAAPAGIRVEGVPRYDLFASPIEQTLQHLFHDPRRAAQVVPAGSPSDVAVRVYRELGTLARLAWNPYLYDPRLARHLGRVTAPALVAWGENDRVLPPPHGERFASLLPNATLRLFPDCGHLIPLEQGEALAEAVLDFVAG